MNKKYLYSTSLFILITFLSSIFLHKKHDKYSKTTKLSYKSVIENHPIQKRLAMTKKERKKATIPPNKFFDQQYLLEMDPATGKTYPEHIEVIKTAKSRKVKTFGVPGESDALHWTERGPNNIGGRTRVVFFDPNDVTSKRVFAGGVSGGLWVNNDITNENSQWTQVGIDENLAISSYSIDPNNSNIWYIGTGESYSQNDGTGNGLWKSVNGGATWNKVFSTGTNGSTQDRVYFINEVLAWNNNGVTEVFISVDTGFDYDVVGENQMGWKKSVDGGNTFQNIDFSFNSTFGNIQYAFSHVEVASDNSIWVATNFTFGGGGKIFQSLDGVNFIERYSFSNGARTELCISKQDPNKIYAVSVVPSGVQLVKTIDGFKTSRINIGKPNDVDLSIPADDFARNQGNYNLVIKVDPTNDNIIYAGGIDLFRSENGGVSWTQISKWSNENNLRNLQVPLVHADMHAIEFMPTDNKKMIFGNDGGVYYSSDITQFDTSTEAIQARNNGYNVTQFYSVASAVFDSNFEIILGGAQDNGSQLIYGANSGINSSFDIFGGDGINNFIDKDGAYIITSFVNNVYASREIPLTVENINQPPLTISDDQNSGDFVNAADLDDNLDILYTNGSVSGQSRISRFTDLLGSPNRTNFTSFTFSGDPTAIQVSPFTTTGSTVFVGTEIGELVKATNLNTDTPTWTNIDLGFDINTGAISDINFGANEDEIIVTLHNYGIDNIYHTIDGGDTWLAKDGDFPDIPVKAIIMNPFSEDEVIIGTNLGVWRTANFTDEDPHWELSANGMSNVRVTHFDYRPFDNTVAAATYGRGIFTGQFQDDEALSNEGIPLNKATIYSSNGMIYIESLNDLEIADVEILDIKGRTVFNQKVDFSSHKITELNVDFNDGVYIVNILSKNIKTSKKVFLKH